MSAIDGTAAGKPVPRSVPRRRAIVELTPQVIGDVAPLNLAVLSIVTDSYDNVPPSRGRIANAVLKPRHQVPTAFDEELGRLVLQLTLVVLHGVVTGAFESLPEDNARRGPLRTWWYRRRLAARLRRARAPEGSDSTVPVIPREAAERIGRAVRPLAVQAGLSTVDADRYAAQLVATLTALQDED